MIRITESRYLILSTYGFELIFRNEITEIKQNTLLNACLTLFPQKQINTELTLEIQRLTLTRQTSYKKL